MFAEIDLGEAFAFVVCIAGGSGVVLTGPVGTKSR